MRGVINRATVLPIVPYKRFVNDVAFDQHAFKDYFQPRFARASLKRLFRKEVATICYTKGIFAGPLQICLVELHS